MIGCPVDFPVIEISPCCHCYLSHIYLSLLGFSSLCTVLYHRFTHSSVEKVQDLNFRDDLPTQNSLYDP
jgi:hypothetical protein